MVYPIDPTGLATSNKIINETKNVSPPGHVSDASFFIPRVTPFFREGLTLTHGTRILVENVDYQLVFRSVALSEHFERELFGGIMMVNYAFTGTVKLTYQVLGGDFQNDDHGTLERIVRAIGAVRWVTYDQIVGVPSNFPPAYHQHDVETDLVNMGSVVDAVEKVVEALNGAPQSITEVSIRLGKHISDEYAHSKKQVGLSNVENMGVATLTELKASSRKYVTADTLVPFIEDYFKPAAGSSTEPGESIVVTIARITNDIEDAKQDIADIVSHLPLITQNITKNTADIETNKTAVDDNKVNINTNKTDINTNKTNISTSRGLIDALTIKLTAQEDISARQQVEITANKTAITNLLNRLIILENQPPPVSSVIPIGGIFHTTVNYVNGAAVTAALGYGVWIRWAEGRVMVGLNTATTTEVWSNKMNNTHGEYTHKLTAQELPKEGNQQRQAGYWGARGHPGGGFQYAGSHQGGMVTLPDDSNGWKGVPFNITQPSVTTGVWLRVDGGYIPTIT